MTFAGEGKKQAGGKGKADAKDKKGSKDAKGAPAKAPSREVDFAILRYILNSMKSYVA